MYGKWSLIITVVLYFHVAIDAFRLTNYPMAVAFSCYAIANIAFVWAIYKDYPLW